MKGLIVTVLLSYGGALASLFNPYIGLLVYICFAVLKPEAVWFLTPGSYSRVVAIGLLIGWAMKGFGDWKFGRGKAIVTLLIGFWLWATLCMLLAPSQELALKYVESLTKVVLPFLVGVTVIDSVQKLKTLVWVIVLTQGYVAFELNVSFYRGFNRVDDFAGLDNNSVAMAMVCCVGPAFFLVLHAKHWWAKGAAAVSGVFIAHVVIFSLSRGGVLAMILTGLVSALLLPPKYYPALGLAGVLGVFMAGPNERSRFLTVFLDSAQRDESAQSRLDLWRDLVDTMLKNPIFGQGPDNWPVFAAPAYGWPLGKEGHSLWLQTGAEMGIPGIALLLSFYGVCVLLLLKLVYGKQELSDPWLRHLSRMVIAAIIGFAVAAQFVSLSRLELPYYIVLIGVGVLKLASVPARTGSPASPPQIWATRRIPARAAQASGQPAHS